VPNAIALSSVGCKVNRATACDDGYAAALSETFELPIVCRASVCSGRLSPAVARRLSSIPPPEVAGRPDAQVIEKCADVSSKPDAKFSSGAVPDPCCGWGGSACTHVYTYAVSESAGALCIVM